MKRIFSVLFLLISAELFAQAGQYGSTVTPTIGTVDSTIVTKLNGDDIRTAAIGATQLAPTAVTAGSYTNTNVTFDADGRAIAASNGTAGQDAADSSGWQKTSTTSTDLVNRTSLLLKNIKIDMGGTQPIFRMYASDGDSVSFMLNTSDVFRWSGAANMILGTAAKGMSLNIISPAGIGLNVSQADGSTGIIWDASNDRMGIGVASPSTTLHLDGTGVAGNAVLRITESAGSIDFSVGNMVFTTITTYDMQMQAGLNAVRWSLTSSMPSLSIGNDYAGSATVPRYLAQANDATAVVGVQIGNSTTGVTTSDGFVLDILGSGEGRVWHRENKETRFGVNGVLRAILNPTGTTGSSADDSTWTLRGGQHVVGGLKVDGQINGGFVQGALFRGFSGAASLALGTDQWTKITGLTAETDPATNGLTVVADSITTALARVVKITAKVDILGAGTTNDVFLLSIMQNQSVNTQYQAHALSSTTIGTGATLTICGLFNAAAADDFSLVIKNATDADDVTIEAVNFVVEGR